MRYCGQGCPECGNCCGEVVEHHSDGGMRVSCGRCLTVFHDDPLEDLWSLPAVEEPEMDTRS